MQRRAVAAIACIAVSSALVGCGGGVDEPSGRDLTAVPPARVEVDGTNGLIVFERSPTPGTAEIHVIHPDGTGEAALTKSPEVGLQGVWSPDGTRIAFVSNRDGNREIYTMAADGSAVARVTTSPDDDLYPTWSPDGTRIAFTRVSDGEADIWVTDAAGGDESQLTDDGTSISPDWSPDGSRIAFVSGGDEESEIYVISPDGADRARLTDNAVTDGAPNWSPDGRKIIFERQVGDGAYDIFVMAWDGSAAKNLTRSDDDEGVPAWSPDGTRIVFTSSSLGTFQLYVARADGSEPTLLTASTEQSTHADWQATATGAGTGGAGGGTTTGATTTDAEPTTTTTATPEDPGKAIFASAGCGGCHSLADAGASGSAGPNLDDVSPSRDKIVERVTEGRGTMPSYESKLSEDEIEALADYVSRVAGGG